ncbi:hypothetical protein EXE48_09135 [Halorubrum sp. ASP1]|uniref:hypothetical protein n=1 Tax=Halorubrum sp. ASP1 TaxID=2518114 RepID=UPI0010F88976|nr:hypothetical protein [Halorubrum sp. ASP1]TKX61196.1 hypothetical protein EXE48_09135 [Halorubrum sp. ASP1]
MPEVVERETERTFGITDHTVQQVAVETGSSVLATYECVDCGASANSVLVFDQLDCEAGEFDRPEALGEPSPMDMRAHRDVEAIVDDLERNESVEEVKLNTDGRDRVSSLRVRLTGTIPGTRDIGSVLRDQDLVIAGSGVSPAGDLSVQLTCPEVTRFAA